MKTPEGYEKDDIKKFLDTLDYCWYFCPYMAGFGKAGVPDIIACIRGRFFAIEVKREGKEPTPRQSQRMGEIETAEGTSLAGTADRVIAQIKTKLKHLEEADLLGGI